MLSIAALPSAPTFDWTTKAAQAIARIHPQATIGLIVATLNKDHSRITAESTGVGHHWESSTPMNNESRAGNPPNPEHERCALDRIDATPIHLPQTALSTGYLTHASKLLPSWFAHTLSDPWNTSHPDISTQTIAAYAPIYAIDDSTNPNTPCLLAITRADPHSLPNLALLLSEAMSAIVHKARITFDTPALNNRLANFNPTPYQWLTQREQTILDQLVEGKSVRVIAECIGRSPHTVHDHVKNLHRKLNACSRGQLIARAIGHPTPPSHSEMLNLTIDPDVIEKRPAELGRQSRTSPELKLAQPLHSAMQHSTEAAPQRLRATPLNRSSETSRAAL
ncbi:MAG: response regulator transcription factor [Phycisphaerales bacterium]